MSAMIVVGSQWGDEGKGKLVDAMAAKSHAVVRFQGGANAGHTLVVKGEKTVLHLIPSGVLHPHVRCLIGPGVTVDPSAMVTEIQALKEQGFLSQDQQLSISDACLLVLPFHKHLDHARERWKKATHIGTTGRGIGPSYEDRASRRALLFGDLFGPDLKAKLQRATEEKNILLQHLYNETPVDVEQMYSQLLELKEGLKAYRCEDVGSQVHSMIQEGKTLLFEGAQGVLLDNLHGTFPYVTSSSTGAPGAYFGVGINPKHISKVYGITKAYCTRVGEGPFPTEQKNKDGELLQTHGHEFGATTGRRRRCGWLDLVALRYAIRVGGLDELILTKLDVLSCFSKIKVCTQYKLQGKVMDEFSLANSQLQEVEPLYTELPGWQRDISKARREEDLPSQARDYVNFIKGEVGLDMGMISVGPDRNQTILSGA